MEEIRAIEIDFDKNILKINGADILNLPIIVTLPGSDGWPLKKLFNPELASGKQEECGKIEVAVTVAKSKPS